MYEQDDILKNMDLDTGISIEEIVTSHSDGLSINTEIAELSESLVSQTTETKVVTDGDNKDQTEEEPTDKKICFKFETMKELIKVSQPYSKSDECFLKGCKWSPDGTCLVTNSEDNILKLYDVTTLRCADMNSLAPILNMKEGETIYDFCWYPKMNSLNPDSCVCASVSKNSPVHLWDAYTGLLRCTYQPIDQYDEVVAANSLCFSLDGSKLYCGFKKCVRIFDTSTPGRISENRQLKSSSVYQTGIISCIAMNPGIDGLYALGCFDKTIGLYSEPDGDLLCILRGQKCGVTHIQFSEDGTKLFSGSRKDNEILCWDLRSPGVIFCSIKRKVNTNQRIYFDLLKNSYIVTGSTNGDITIHDILSDNATLVHTVSSAHGGECVNGISYNDSYSILATTSGQRHFQLHSDLADEEEKGNLFVENSLKLWSVQLTNT